ncbi:unnamed protein product [Cylindrotheca closterium]|uniref:Uncharacterized protein n=1 Tax=Cylindrotheca closterium TaxID=2856 RepID=A0AAD2CHM3_9STRA|nr:unnamed protein product [Cylindrotheca closterium]
MSLNTTSQRAFSMLRRMRPSGGGAAAAVTTTHSNNGYTRNNNVTPFPTKNDDTRRFLQTTNHDSVKPTMEIAKLMPVGLPEMNNETLVTIAALGHHQARCEALVRHIMSIDGVDYDAATTKFQEIEQSNRAGMAVYPYFIGISGGMLAAFGSLPLVFNLNTAVWFNEFYVTTDIPEPKDLETMLEVGSWTWNWMEPPLGALSFSLLCLQYARAQMENLGLHPYTTQVVNSRADKLAAAFPQYDPFLLRQFSKSAPLFKRTWS